MAFIDVSSQIIKSYLAGLESRRRREKDKNDLQLHKDAAEERKKEFTETLKQQKAHFDAQHALSKTLADLKTQESLMGIAKDTATTGITPPGATETLSNTTTPEQDFNSLNDATFGMAPNQVRPGTQGPAVNRNIQLLTGQQMQVPDLMTVHQRLADAKRLDLKPGTEAAIEKAAGIGKVLQPGKLELITERGAAEAKAQVAKLQGQKELAAIHDAAAYTRAIDVANIRNKGRNAGVKDRLLNDKELAGIPGAKVGDTVFMHRGSTLAKELTPKELETVRENDSLLKDLTVIKGLGDEKGLYSLTDPVTGTIKNITSKFGGGTDEEALFRNKLGEVKATLTALRAGKTLTKNEEKLLDRYSGDIGSGERNTRVAVEQLINAFTDRRNSILMPSQKLKNTPPTGITPIKRKITHGGKEYNTVSTDGGLTFKEE